MSLLEELKTKRSRAAITLGQSESRIEDIRKELDYAVKHRDDIQDNIADIDKAIAVLEAPHSIDLNAELRQMHPPISALTPPLQHKGGETEAGDKLAEFMKLDGAVKWEGGEMPVPVGATVDVLFNDGNLIEASRAEIWSRVPHGHDYWRDKPFNTRIVAYRIIATMSEHDRSAKSPLDERVWVHFMSAGGFSGGNGWSDELDWTKVDLYEIRPEGPPHLALSEPLISTLQASSGEGETGSDAADGEAAAWKRQASPSSGSTTHLREGNPSTVVEATESQTAEAAAVECNLPFARIPQHAADPGTGDASDHWPPPVRSVQSLYPEADKAGQTPTALTYFLTGQGLFGFALLTVAMASRKRRRQP